MRPGSFRRVWSADAMGLLSRLRRPTPPPDLAPAQELVGPAPAVRQAAIAALDHVTALNPRGWTHVELPLEPSDGGLAVVEPMRTRYTKRGPRKHAVAHFVERAPRLALLNAATRIVADALAGDLCGPRTAWFHARDRERVVVTIGHRYLAIDPGEQSFGEAFDMILDRRARPMLARIDALEDSLRKYGAVRHYEPDASVLHFVADDGRKRELPVIPLGSHDRESHRWRWSWADSTLPEGRTEVVGRRIRDLHAGRPGLAGMRTAEFSCDPAFASTVGLYAADELGSRPLLSWGPSGDPRRLFFAV